MTHEGGHKSDMSCCRPKGIPSLFEMAEMRKEWQKKKREEKEKAEKTNKDTKYR